MHERGEATYGFQWGVYTPEDSGYYTGQVDTGDITLVVAKDNEEAKEHYIELYKQVKGCEPDWCSAWVKVDGESFLNIYGGGEVSIADVYHHSNIDWSRADDKPWLLNDPDEALNDYIWDLEEDELEEEEDVEYRVGIQRDCVCGSDEEKGNTACPLCAGEGTITRWVEVDYIRGSEVRLSRASLDDVFSDVAAYELLIEKGYEVSRKLT